MSFIERGFGDEGKPFRVSVHTILGKDPFYFHFDDIDMSMAFIRDIMKHGLKVGIAYFTPKAFTGIALEGPHGVNVIPPSAVAFPTAAAGGEKVQ